MNWKSPIDRVWISEFFGTTDPTIVTIISLMIVFAGTVSALTLCAMLYKLSSVKVVLAVVAIMLAVGYVSLAWNGNGFDYFPFS